MSLLNRIITNYKEKKENQIGNRFEDLKKQYAGGVVLSIYDVTNPYDGEKLRDIGLQKYAKDEDLYNVTKLAKVAVDQNNEIRYSIHGDYDNSLKRYFAILDANGEKIGSINEHKKLFGPVYETINYRGIKLGDLHHDYTFSNTQFIVERVGTVLSAKHFIIRNIIGIMMENGRVRGQEYVAVSDPNHLDESILLYTAIDLLMTPKPDSDDEDL